MKKCLLITLSLMFLFSTLVANGSSEQAADVSDFADKDNVTAAGTFPIAKEKVTLSLFSDVAESILDYPMKAWLEEMTNIAIEWSIEAKSGAADKLMVQFASDSLADITKLTGDATNTQAGVIPYARDGYFYPLDDMIDEYGDTIKAWRDDEKALFEATSVDGKIYGLPWRPISYSDQFAMRLMINHTWLENLDLEMPETVEEFYEVLVAFKYKDANGNGDPNDEIPFSATTTRSMTQSNSPLFDPFFVHTDWLTLKNGKVDTIVTKEDFRTALRFYNKMWEEGLIYSESFSQDRGTQWQLNEAPERPIIGATVGQHLNYTCSWNSEVWKEYSYITVLDGPAGKNVQWRSPSLAGRINTVISSKTEYPVIAFRLLDYLSSEEGHIVRYLGLEGEHYRKATPDELGTSGEPAMVTPLDGAEKFGWGHIITPYGGVNDFFDTVQSVSQEPSQVNEDGFTTAQMNYQVSLDAMNYVRDVKDIYPTSIVYPEEAKLEVAILKTNFTTLVDEAAAKFITGEMDLDKDWDTFQKNLQTAELDKYLAISQDAYDMFWSK